MKVTKFFKSTCVCMLLLLAVACTSPANKAFTDGTLKEGSTYEEVIKVLGEPTKEYKNDKGVLLTYFSLTALENFYVLCEKKDGACTVKAFSNDNATAASYQFYLDD